MYYRWSVYYRGKLIQSFLVTYKYLKMCFQFPFFPYEKKRKTKPKTCSFSFKLLPKTKGLSDVNHVYTSAYTLKSLPLLGSDFCIQLMESYLDKVLEMIKRGQIQIYTLKKSRSRCQLTHLCIFWKRVGDMHVHFIRTFKEFSTFYCGYVSTTTLDIKKTLTLIFWYFMLDTLTPITIWSN